MFARQGLPSQARRQFLLASTAVAANTFVGPDSLPAAESLTLRRSATDLFRARIEMSVEGNINVPNNPRVSRQADVRLPIKSDAVLDYEERYHWAAGGDSGHSVALAERYYHEAHQHSSVNRDPFDSQLRDSVRQTIVCRQTLPEVVFAVHDYFDQDELDLLRVPVASVAVDRLLPSGAIESSNQYEPATDALAAVLNLSSIESRDVWGEIVAIGDRDVKIQFRGKISGSVQGVPTAIRAAGKLRFDREADTTVWLSMGIHETREAGEAEPGFDIAATVKMIRQPLDQVVALPPRKPPLSVSDPPPSDRLHVDLKSKQVGFAALMDRRWRMMSDVPGWAMMRLVVNDRSLAQCDFRPLTPVEPGNHATLEQFQQDVRRMLGTRLSDVIEADQRVNQGGLRVLRVAARGSVQQQPIQWVLLHVSSDQGRRLQATFMMESGHVAPFARSDTQLAATIRFFDPPDRQAGETAGKTADRPIATANSGEEPESRVQSASDLRRR